jgi:hypothetical protein
MPGLSSSGNWFRLRSPQCVSPRAEKRAAVIHFDANWDAKHRAITRDSMADAERVLAERVNFGEVDCDPKLAKSIPILSVPSVASGRQSDRHTYRRKPECTVQLGARPRWRIDSLIKPRLDEPMSAMGMFRQLTSLSIQTSSEQFRRPSLTSFATRPKMLLSLNIPILWVEQKRGDSS